MSESICRWSRPNLSEPNEKRTLLQNKLCFLELIYTKLINHYEEHLVSVTCTCTRLKLKRTFCILFARYPEYLKLGIVQLLNAMGKKSILLFEQLTGNKKLRGIRTQEHQYVLSHDHCSVNIQSNITFGSEVNLCPKTVSDGFESRNICCSSF